METRVLSDNQIGKLHDTSMAILDRVGVQIPHEDMLRRLEAAGARVDHAAQRACLGEKLVLGCLQQAGKQYTLYGRDLSRRAAFGQGKRNYNSVVGG